MADETKRQRRRRELKIDDAAIAERVLHFFDTDDAARSQEKQDRIQRYAKYRMWTEGKDWPWEDSSDIPLSDMTEKSLRMQDTLHNAVMSSRPPISAAALDQADSQKERTIDNLIDSQIFVEQDGEATIGDLADAFVNDGVATAFVPWVKEMREVSDARMFDPIPEQSLPIEYFDAIVRREFSQAQAVPVGRTDGWDWRLQQDGKRIDVSFYTSGDDRVEMVVKREVVVYDGPRIIQKEWEDVLYPARSANLQIPGPSNPHGAPHVILVDYPTIDEVRRLAKQGIYDRLDPADLDALEATAQDKTSDETKQQKDVMQGVTPDETAAKAPRHRTVTRLMCFDIFDIDGDGTDEDVVWWVIREIKKLARAKSLTEAFPASKPRRPLFGRSFIPIRGRHAGISFLETLEGLHDTAKEIVDQTVDAGTIANVPFFFYRPSGSMKPEIIRMTPGEGYPLQDPKRDVEFPQFNNQGQVFGLNMLGILMQMEERVSMVGELQFGRVPQGKASALRTLGGMALITSQGEARPERILRRFFMLLTDIWRHVHDLNQHFLPEDKRIRLVGLKEPADDPYLVIKRRDDIAGDFEFDFKANILNTSKAALQQSIGALIQVYVSDLAFKLGIINADGVFRLFRELGYAWGQNPDRYLTAPSAEALKPRLFAEEAISQIMDGQIPDGSPAEPGGHAEHLAKLSEFMSDDRFGLLTPEQVELFRGYVQEVQEKAAQEARQQAIAAAAGQFGQGFGVGSTGRPPEGPPENPQDQPQLQPGELLDEALPGAGGGANTGVI